jgi:hypothetical protein
MAFNVEINCRSSFVSPHPIEKTMVLLADYESSIGNNFKGLETFRSLGGDVYEWTFEKLSYGGYDLQIRFKTKLEQKGADLIQIIPVATDSKTSLSGYWKMVPTSQGTQVNFFATLVGELPLPGFMKSMIAPLAQREVQKIFDQYISHVSTSFNN